MQNSFIVIPFGLPRWSIDENSGITKKKKRDEGDKNERGEDRWNRNIVAIGKLHSFGAIIDFKTRPQLPPSLSLPHPPIV